MRGTKIVPERGPSPVGNVPAYAGNTSWAQPSSYRFCFKGIPKHSIVATFTVGVANDEQAQKVWHDGMREAMRRLEPSRALLYGKNIGFNFGNCKVVEYKAGGLHGR